ncbi:MAG: hypothetical protein ACM3MD_11745 [Betaproteobacteria bacterium]
MRFNNFETHTRAKTLAAPSDAERDIRRAAFDCLNRFELTRKVRLIGVRLSGLEKRESPSSSERTSDEPPPLLSP